VTPTNGRQADRLPETAAEGRTPSTPWHRKLLCVLFAIICFEIGVYLVLAPWGDSWKSNYFATLRFSFLDGIQGADWWRKIWASPYFRGAISGIGMVNIYISICEIFRLRRFAAGAD